MTQTRNYSICSLHKRQTDTMPKTRYLVTSTRAILVAEEQKQLHESLNVLKHLPSSSKSNL